MGHTPPAGDDVPARDRVHPAFGGIADWQRDVYIGTLLSTVLAAVLFVGPVSYHRVVFRQKMRGSLVRASNIADHAATVG